MPPSEDPNSSQTNALGFDEFIGILIAFTTIGEFYFGHSSIKIRV